MESPQARQKWASRFKRDASVHLSKLATGLETVQPRLLPEAHTTDSAANPEAVDLSALNPELRELFRLAHTLKGSAGMVEQLRVAAVAEKLETELGKVYREPSYFNEDLRQRMLVILAELTQEVERIG
jgi:chemotaxis protein histidine kinase CheA